jgi:hypothetical protein
MKSGRFPEEIPESALGQLWAIQKGPGVDGITDITPWALSGSFGSGLIYTRSTASALALPEWMMRGPHLPGR